MLCFANAMATKSNMDVNCEKTIDFTVVSSFLTRVSASTSARSFVDIKNSLSSSRASDVLVSSSKSASAAAMGVHCMADTDALHTGHMRVRVSTLSTQPWQNSCRQLVRNAAVCAKHC